MSANDDHAIRNAGEDANHIGRASLYLLFRQMLFATCLGKHSFQRGATFFVIAAVFPQARLYSAAGHETEPEFSRGAGHRE